MSDDLLNNPAIPNNEETSSEVTSADNGHLLESNKEKTSVKITRKYVPAISRPKRTCATPKVRYVYLLVGTLLFVVSLVLMVAGTIRVNQCQTQKFPWITEYFENDIDHHKYINNYALEKTTHQSSTRVEGADGYSELAVDGDITTCSRTDMELLPKWWVDLGTLRPIQLVLIKGKPNISLHNVNVKIEETNPSVNGSNSTLCPKKLYGSGDVISTTCGRNVNGRYVVVEMMSHDSLPTRLVICEVVVIQR